MKTLAQNELHHVAGGKLVDFREAYNVPPHMLAPCVMVEVDDITGKPLPVRTYQPADFNTPGSIFIVQD